MMEDNSKANIPSNDGKNDCKAPKTPIIWGCIRITKGGEGKYDSTYYYPNVNYIHYIIT
jgi:hypothetical protein